MKKAMINSDYKSECNELSTQQNRPTGKQIAASILAERRNFHTAALASCGRFDTYRDMVNYASIQYHVFNVPRSEVAADAGIPLDVLEYLFSMNKVPSAMKANGLVEAIEVADGKPSLDTRRMMRRYFRDCVSLMGRKDNNRLPK